MRSVSLCVLSLLTIAAATSSQAADLDYSVLRGPDEDVYVPPADWSGAYIGGHGGYTSGAFGFDSTSRDIVANALRNTTIENELNVSGLLRQPSVRADGGSFGGYAGWNFQYDDMVFGIEVDYTSLYLQGSSFDNVGRQALTSDGMYNSVNLAGTSATKIQDYGTVRGRAGYAMGSFLPFVTGGVAIGRARVLDNVGIQAYGYDQAAYNANQGLAAGAKPQVVNNYGYSYFDDTSLANSVVAPAEQFGRSKTKVVGGVTAGAGLDFALTSNIILRAEYQWVLFNDFEGHKANLNTVRAGAAVKF